MVNRAVNGVVTSYQWDGADRLAQVQNPTQTVTFKYDPFGRRVAKTVTKAGNAATQYYVYEGPHRIADYDEGHTLLAQYFFGPGMDLPVKIYRPIEGWRTYFTDGRHTVAAVQQVQGGGQPKATAYQYDTFGSLLSASGDAYPQPFTFTGREWDVETGLYYYRARYYDPALGRFLSEDPIGFASGDVNLYRYVGNNPIRFIDPFGLSSLTYDSGTGSLTLYDGSGNVVGQYPAGNNTTANSNGPWPTGTYDYSYHTDHPESGPNGPYGSNGNFVFDVPVRSGMGVHSGRNGPQSRTNGCIRTTDQGTQDISNLNSTDPLTTITVQR